MWIDLPALPYAVSIIQQHFNPLIMLPWPFQIKHILVIDVRICFRLYARLETRQSPGDVLPDERGSVRRARPKCRHGLWRGRAVAERDSNVPQPKIIAYSIYGATGHPFVEIGRGPREQFDQCRRIEIMPHPEIRLGAQLGKTIPRTHDLTVVATIDAVADE